MSIHGGVRREMTFLAFKWQRFIDDDSTRLQRGWILDITVGPMDIGIGTIPNRRYFTARKWEIVGFGYGVGVTRNWESPKKYVFGDASERLLNKKVK